MVIKLKRLKSKRLNIYAISKKFNMSTIKHNNQLTRKQILYLLIINKIIYISDIKAFAYFKIRVHIGCK